MKVTYISIALALCFTFGCRTGIDPALRSKVLSDGHPLFLPVLDYQMRNHILPGGIKNVGVTVPSPEPAGEYASALRTLYPACDVVTTAKGEGLDRISIIGIRRTGALIGEVFGSVTIDGKETRFLYYLKIGRPIPGEPHLWSVAKEESWPSDTPLPLRP